MPRENFEAVIGLEIHAEISTKSKMFCPCSSDAFNAEQNTNVCPVCMGFPGQLPVINQEAVKRGLIAALALNCSIPSHSKFDRKNYFYPDLPKGYQISQYDEPVAEHGWLDIDGSDGLKKIGITRLHLEDDAGKLTHIENGTLCDYNRSGIPLMEIVSDPDIRSAKEAQTYAKMMQTILRYVGASDADMEKGMMRFDASVSIRPIGDSKLYPRAEIKNLNSFRSLESAIDYEIERQIFLWKKGEKMDSDITVGWSDDHGKTYFLRDKEAAHDYRYFPEPDLPPLDFMAAEIEELKKAVPEMPAKKKERFISEMKMSITEAELLSADPDLASFFEKTLALSGNAKMTTTFTATVLLSFLNKTGITVSEMKITPELLAKLIKMVDDGKISISVAKAEVFEDMFNTGNDPEAIVESKGLAQVSDKGEIEKICQEVVAANPKSVEDFKNGKQQALGFVVGQVMKKTQGKANPGMVNEILKQIITK